MEKLKLLKRAQLLSRITSGALRLTEVYSACLVSLTLPAKHTCGSFPVLIVIYKSQNCCLGRNLDYPYKHARERKIGAHD